MNLQYFIKNNKKGLHSSELLLGKSSTTGFTTFELIIAISIIVILTAIALPKLNNFTTTLTDNTVSFTRFTGASSSIGTITITTTSGAYTKTSVIRMYTSGLAALD